MIKKSKTIIWRDAYTHCESDKEGVEKTLGKTAVATSCGVVVKKTKHYVVLQQNQFNDIQKHNDYMVIPKGCIIKIK